MFTLIEHRVLVSQFTCDVGLCNVKRCDNELVIFKNLIRVKVVLRVNLGSSLMPKNCYSLVHVAAAKGHSSEHHLASIFWEFIECKSG